MRAVSHDNVHNTASQQAVDEQLETATRRNRERIEQLDDHMHDYAETRRHSRFGGLEAGAAFFGWLVATAIGVLLTALLVALGGAIALTQISTISQMANNARTVSLIGSLALLLTSFVAYYAGGYVAGRLAGSDGGRQGLGVWLVSLVAALVLGLAGVWFGNNFNLLQGLNLPSLPISGQSFTDSGLATIFAILLVTVLASISGGRSGQQYRHSADTGSLLNRSPLARAIQHQRLAHH